MTHWITGFKKDQIRKLLKKEPDFTQIQIRARLDLTINQLKRFLKSERITTRRGTPAWGLRNLYTRMQGRKR